MGLVFRISKSSHDLYVYPRRISTDRGLTEHHDTTAVSKLVKDSTLGEEIIGFWNQWQTVSRILQSKA